MNSLIDNFIGNNIIALRKKRDLTQDDLAEQLGLSRQQIQKYEVGETKIPATVLYSLAEALHVKIEHFFEGLADIQPKAILQSGVIQSVRRQPINILLIEDSLADEKLTRSAIEQCEYDTNIYTVHTGVEAISTLLNYKKISTIPRPDIILLDLNIPKKNGLEVLKTIKSDRDIQDIPVIIVTNSINAEEMRKVYKLGAGGFVVKSFDPEDFFAKIKVILDYWHAMVLPVM